jgi:hypothetical protein
MGFYKYEGALIDVSVLSNGKEGSEGWVVEFWDLTPGSPGELMHIYVDADGSCNVDVMAGTVNSDFIDWALSIVRLELK